MYHNHTACRACGYGKPALPTLKESTAAGPTQPAEKLIPVFDLGIQPLANDFSKTGECKGWAPLKVLFCPRCTLAQLSVTVDPDVLYSNYPYVTSNSHTMGGHFGSLRAEIGEESPLDRVLEIGSNDGAFLKYLHQHGTKEVIGIDPADNLAAAARSAGVFTITAIFDADSAEDANQYLGSRGADVILARHVFCHVDDWRAFLSALSIPSHRETLVCIEVPYVVNLLQGAEFDTIYHEHTSYFSLQAMQAALEKTGWHMHKVLHFDIHGGAVSVMLRRDDSKSQPDKTVESELLAEKAFLTLEAWRQFAVQSENQIEALRNYIRKLREAGKRVVGYGASAKSTVLINACRFRRSEIEFITDNTPQKQWTLSPGSDIPIVDPGALTRELPDYALCFAWNFFPEIFEQERIYREAGKHWILPHPEIKVT